MTTRKTVLLMVTLLVGLLVSSQSSPVTAASTQIITDFESGEPVDWFAFSGGGATTATIFPTVPDSDPLARPGQVGDNTFVEATFDATTGFAGFGQDFANSGGSQDWSSFTAVSFYLYGANTGQPFQFEIFDNRSDPASDTAERFDTILVDDFTGWQQVTIPFADFTRATDFQPGGAPDDGLTLTEMWGMAVILDGAVGTLLIDDIGLERAIIDDFESGLPSGTDGDGVPIGFFTFSDGSPISITTTDAPPAPVPGAADPNNVMALTGDVVAFAGFIHAFENTAVDTWVPQDWSSFEGFSFWLYGQNSGTTLFVDIIDNRNPGSTGDDAERFTISLIDDFSGWLFFEFPFSSFVRKEIGNGAPNDGFTLTEVHGWALGTLDTPGEVTYYIDDAALYGNAEIPELAVTYTAGRYDIEEGTTGDITVKLNRPMNSDDPVQVSVDYFTEPGVALPDREYLPTAGTLTFVNGGPSELSFPLETIDDTKWEGDERIILRLANPVDVAAGFATQASAFIIENDPYDPYLIDDFSYGAYQWDSPAGLVFTTPEIAAGDALAIPGQDPYETVLQVAPAAGPSPAAIKAQVIEDLTELLPSGDRLDDRRIGKAILRLQQSQSTAFWLSDYYLVETTGKQVFDRDKQAIHELTKVVEAGNAAAGAAEAAIEQLLSAEGTLVELAINLALENGGQADKISEAMIEQANAAAEIANGDYEEAAASYREAWKNASKAIQGIDLAPAAFGLDFALGQDWSNGEALRFWFYGTGSGDEIGVTLKDNRAPDPGPTGWSMVWSEEFNDPAGTPPNPDFWTYEIGDVTPDGKNGWGNDELQYYTDDPANAATDGQGNMVLTVEEADGSLDCYYGTCEYTSARLISWRKAEFAYGRIESRILVPQGGGIWPAFWSLGTDIDLVSWPQTGEIDFMEFVGRLPNEIFGTIHGPGYAGGASFGNVYDFGEPVFNDYHTFAVEWEPDLIRWYVDDILYHTATPTDVAPNEWVFNDPIFLLLNVAIGGNFGGAVDPNIPLPQSMAVDYIRVYQGPDTAERFETSFVDDFSGWQEVVVPFSSFSRSVDQPSGAPDDGLGLNEVWGYGFTLPKGGQTTSQLLLDQIRVQPIPPPTALTVTTLADSGEGSLRDALGLIAPDGTITFDPSLAGGTIALTSGELAIDSSVTVDGSGAPGLIVSGSNASRVFQVAAGISVSLNDLTVSDGAGAPQGGGILNYGVLNLDNVTVTNNTESSAGGAAFDLGGGGIYNGDGATLNLTNSSVSNNSTLGQPGGGIYGFFNSNINLTNSTVSGNVAGDVAGGLRTLGNANIVNSTLSGNTSTAWHGGAMFITDGVVTILNSTIIDNNAPGGTAGGLFVGTFGDSDATLTLQNSIVANNGDFNCIQFFGAGTVSLTSLENNVFSDGTCAPIGNDQIVADAGVDVLADNGGPTLTHALLAGSPAIDAANTAVCPTTDQRGITRDAACDAGAYEFVP